MSFTREQIEKAVKNKGYTWFNDDSNKTYDVNIVGVRNNHPSIAKKVTNVLIADNNTLSFGDEKLELSNKDLILPESETLGWMSVLGPLYNNNDILIIITIIL